LHLYYFFFTANLQIDLEAGKVRWLLNDLSGDNNFTVVTDAVVATYEWVHIAATYNATTKEAKVFINAKEMATAKVESKIHVILLIFCFSKRPVRLVEASIVNPLSAKRSPPKSKVKMTL